MKISSNFALRNIAGNWVALPLGTNNVVDFTGMLTLNESGLLLWRALESGATEGELCAALLNEYDVTEEQAMADVAAFIEKLRDIGCIED